MSNGFNTFADLCERSRVWYWFKEISAVPRGSNKEEKICKFIMDFAEKFNLEYRQDEIGNLFLQKSAQNSDSKEIVALQGHLDMVWQKTDDSKFDFENQAIMPYVDGEWVTAGATTLGADNGIGVANILTILENTEISHPNIEAIFTVAEETGLTGAFQLDSDKLKATKLINLDASPFDMITIGCAGGLDTVVSFAYDTVDISSNFTGFQIVMEGLAGGHSGVDINKGKENANKLMVRFLQGLTKEIELHINNIKSDYPRNAIPRLCTAIIYVENTKIKDFQSRFQKAKELIIQELKSAEKNLEISCVEHETSDKSVMVAHDQAKILKALNVLPNGVYKLSSQNSALVETSTNTANLYLSNGFVKVGTLQRASSTHSMHDLAEKVMNVFQLGEFKDLKVDQFGEYNGWQPDFSSDLVKVVVALYHDLFDMKPEITACHAGLECAIIDSNHVMDKVSLGPDILDMHAPFERVKTDTVDKLEILIKNLLAKL